MGALGADKVPPKPDELVVYELLQKLNLPLAAGGLLDQPHIWILQYEVIKGVLDEYRALEDTNRKMEEKQNMQKMIDQMRR